MRKRYRRKIKVLHLASFLGNIGDFANHQGFYKRFKKIIPSEFTQLEIRRFYKNRAEMKFDGSFLKLVNQYDLLLLGGGGFFDLKWDYSHTGTTIDFSKEVVKNIKIPVIVNAMGYHEYDEICQENVNKFGNFLDLITSKDNWMVTVRNDGSYARMDKRYGKSVDRVLEVPDNGFFFKPKEYSKFCLKDKNTIWVGMNITNDLFSKKFNKNIDTNSFNSLISKFVNQILKQNNKIAIILFPHTYQDIVTIGQIMGLIEDKYVRERLEVAPLFTVGKPIEQVFDLYRICSCVIGMRFHANVCCIGMHVPTLGLAGHEQVFSLYDELGLPDRCVKVDNVDFSDELRHKLDGSLDNINQIKSVYRKINFGLNKQSDIYMRKVKDFIESRI